MSNRLRRLWECFIRGNPNAYHLWRADPTAFEKWAAENNYTDTAFLLRYHKDGPYSPENCHWSVTKNRGQGRRPKHYLTANGQTHSWAEWARITKLPYETIRRRVLAGWPPEDTIKR